MPSVRIPSALRTLTNGQADIDLPARTVRELIATLDQRHPGIAARLLDAAGALKPFIRMYVGPEDIAALAGLDTELTERDEVAIVPAIAGGDGGGRA